MVVAVIVEILIVGLEDPPVVRIFVRLVTVLSEEDAILIFQEEFVRGARLAAEIVKNGRDVVVDVRVLIEQLAGPGEIVGVPPEVRKDDFRIRVPARW